MKPTEKDNQFNKKEQALIEFLATPEKGRKPGTQKELAKQIDTTEKTLSQWKKRDEIWDAVYDETLKVLQSRLPNILNALADKAEKGSLDHAEMVLELTGKVFNKGSNSGNAVQVNVSTAIPRTEEEVVNIKGGDS